jgi:hypothetical protein
VLLRLIALLRARTVLLVWPFRKVIATELNRRNPKCDPPMNFIALGVFASYFFIILLLLAFVALSQWSLCKRIPSSVPQARHRRHALFFGLMVCSFLHTWYCMYQGTLDNIPSIAYPLVFQDMINYMIVRSYISAKYAGIKLSSVVEFQ